MITLDILDLEIWLHLEIIKGILDMILEINILGTDSINQFLVIVIQVLFLILILIQVNLEEDEDNTINPRNIIIVARIPLVEVNAIIRVDVNPDLPLARQIQILLIRFPD